jgi:hypothetical protein
MFRNRLWVAALACTVVAMPARAAEIDPYLPADTEVVISVNVRQVLDAALLKKLGIDKARAALKEADQVKAILDELGFDPFTDLHRVTIAGPSGTEQDRGLVICRGRFDQAKFKARAEQAARDNGDILKVHKIPTGGGAQHLVYEVAPPEQNVPFFIAVADKDVLLASPGKDYVVDALKKNAAGKVAGLKDKHMKELLENLDDKQSLAVAGLGSALAKGASIPDAAKEVLQKLDAIGGGITVTDEIKLELVLTTKDLDQAKEMEKTVSDGLNQALGLLALLGGQKPELAPVIDFIKTLKAARKERTVILRGRVGADAFDKLLEKDGKRNKDQ